MSGIYFTSDWHFNHKNIQKYCPDTRNGFTSLDEMNTAIINGINSMVNTDDVLYHLGDFGFCSNTKCVEFIDRINCKNVHMCFGNHDSGIKTSTSFKSRLVSHTTGCMELNINGLIIICSHYPIIDPTGRIPDFIQAEIEDLTSKPYDLWLHGHLHGSRKPTGKMFDVGIDTRLNQTPWNLNEILEIIYQKGKSK